MENLRQEELICYVTWSKTLALSGVWVSLCLMFNHTVVAPDVSVQVSSGIETAEAVSRSEPWRGWYKSVVKGLDSEPRLQSTTDQSVT